jgi:hypothetical protein
MSDVWEIQTWVMPQDLPALRSAAIRGERPALIAVNGMVDMAERMEGRDLTRWPLCMLCTNPFESGRRFHSIAVLSMDGGEADEPPGCAAGICSICAEQHDKPSLVRALHQAFAVCFEDEQPGQLIHVHEPGNA